MNVILKAQEEGIIRHIGFSTHSEKISSELCRRFDFESILYPMNGVMGMNTGWGNEVAKIAEDKNIGLLAMKSLAQRMYRDNEQEVFPKSWCKTNFPDNEEDDRLGLLGMKYALYKGADTLVPPGDIWHFRFMLQNVAKALSEPLTMEELTYMKEIAAGWKNEMILDAIHETA